jgi:hypothetical protein
VKGDPVNVRDLLRERGIDAWRAVGSAGLPDALSMSVPDLVRFVNLVAPEGDPLVRRIIGRPQDLDVLDEPWAYELVPGPVSDAGIEFHVIVTIPEADRPTVLARLTDRKEPAA